MNDKIINNLYEFWTHVAYLTGTLTATEHYSSISMVNSDWPNRIFDIKNSKTTIKGIVALSKEGKLPEFVTREKPNELANDSQFELTVGQQNMAFDLSLFSDVLVDPNIRVVATEKEAVDFAMVASQSFGYRVDHSIIYTIAQKSSVLQPFVYKDAEESLACGMVFFDSYNNAGLHMVGTLPKGRGCGIGKSMTEKLLQVAKNNNKHFCVLHASMMGEPIYKKLGFVSYGAIETYRILRP